MSIGSALCDKAVLLPRVEATVRNDEGGYDVDETTAEGPTFRCFYDPGQQNESRDDAGVRLAGTAQLLFGKRAMDGTVLDIKAKDKVRIESPGHGTFVMEILGDPDPIVKRRTRLGYTATLQRVER